MVANVATGILTILLTGVMIMTLATSSWMFMKIDKLKATRDNHYSTLKWLMVGQITLSCAMIAMIIGVAITRTKNAKTSYVIPMLTMIVASVAIVGLSSAMYFSFSKLTGTDPSTSEHKALSTYVFLAPISYTMLSVAVIVAWSFRKQLNSCAEKLKICEDTCNRTKSVIEQKLSEEQKKRMQTEQERQYEELRKQAEEELESERQARELEEEQERLRRKYPKAGSRMGSRDTSRRTSIDGREQLFGRYFD